MRRVPVSIGTKFGRWTTTSEDYKLIIGGCSFGYVVDCICECGTTAQVNKASLLAGKSQSCGCLCRERTSEANKTHGGSCTPELARVYNVWKSIKARCTNPNVECAHNYIGRGITICDDWLDFDKFIKDMGLPPTDKHSIERIDNYDGYYPDNCKWATAKEQGNNRRDNIVVTYQGVTQTLTEWSEDLGIPYSNLKWRYRHGWDTQRMLSV